MAGQLNRSIGKEIGAPIYVFGDMVAEGRKQLPAEFECQVVKYDTRAGNVSFIESSDFDTADEPTVGEIQNQLAIAIARSE